MDNKVVHGISVTRDLINGMIDTVQKLYLADSIPWVIGYSGGKDSTAALQLVWLAIENLPVEQRVKTVHIINTDTLVESPVVSKWAKDSLKHMEEHARERQLPFKTHILKPAVDNTFWVNLIGRGYPFPRKRLRWCTDRLKIRPVNDFIKKKISEHGEIILVLGIRKAESANRARTMAYYERKRVRELLSPNETLVNELVFSPLEEWTDDDVWVFLMQYKNPWGYSNQNLLTLYKGATADGECPLMVEKDLPSCGKSRFGCWVCTMVARDKSMEAMIANDSEKEWMTPLLDFRNEFGDEEKDRERRSYRKMGGILQGSYGKLNHGPYLKEIRERWLRRLLEIQLEISENGPAEFENYEIISLAELRVIRRIWVYDKHEFEDSLPRIYQEVTGKVFHDPEWLGTGMFGTDEWHILKDVCEELYPDEELSFELMYGLLDIENQALGLNKRNDILKKLQGCIASNFYQNEEDALAYYMKKMTRKKNYGGKYDTKFLDNVALGDSDIDDREILNDNDTKESETQGQLFSNEDDK